jgi:hypothetical protein
LGGKIAHAYSALTNVPIAFARHCTIDSIEGAQEERTLNGNLIQQLGTLAMMKLSILAAAALALAPSLAGAEATSAEKPATKTIEYKGERYSYTVKEKDGVRVLEGMMEKGWRPFKLTVGKYYVDGIVDGNPVRFSLKSVKSQTGIVEVASR